MSKSPKPSPFRKAVTGGGAGRGPNRTDRATGDQGGPAGRHPWKGWNGGLGTAGKKPGESKGR